MNRFYYFFIILLLSSCSNTQEKSISYLDTLSIERNIARHAKVFESKIDMSFFDKIPNSRSVILLGEASHFDLSTSEVKIEMIEYLQMKGFNSIVLESAPLLTSYIFGNPRYKNLTKDWLLEKFYDSYYGRQSSCTPLYKMINKREIKVWGCDTDLGLYDIVCIQEIFKQYNSKMTESIDWTNLNSLFLRKFIYYSASNNQPVSIEEDVRLMDTINEITNEVQFLINEFGRQEEFIVLLQWVRNVNTLFSYVKNSNWSEATELNSLTFRNRDSQMAENIIWMTEHFPKEKFIIWCANFHGAKDISQTAYPTDPLLYFVFQSMGEGIYNKLNDKFYSLAFTSLNHIYPDNSVTQSTSALELAISEESDNAPFVFIDFEPLRFHDSFFNKSFEAACIGKKTGKWLHVFDGVFYIKDQLTNSNKIMNE